MNNGIKQEKNRTVPLRRAATVESDWCWGAGCLGRVGWSSRLRRLRTTTWEQAAWVCTGSGWLAKQG
jgi:hypothetical protein